MKPKPKTKPPLNKGNSFRIIEVWVCLNQDGDMIVGTTADTKEKSMMKLGENLAEWIYLKSVGFKCVRAILGKVE